MSPLSSPVVTSYRLPIVITSLSLTVFAVLLLVTYRQTDRQTGHGSVMFNRVSSFEY